MTKTKTASATHEGVTVQLRWVDGPNGSVQASLSMSVAPLRRSPWLASEIVSDLDFRYEGPVGGELIVEDEEGNESHYSDPAEMLALLWGEGDEHETGDPDIALAALVIRNAFKIGRWAS